MGSRIPPGAANRCSLCLICVVLRLAGLYALLPSPGHRRVSGVTSVHRRSPTCGSSLLQAATTNARPCSFSALSAPRNLQAPSPHAATACTFISTVRLNPKSNHRQAAQSIAYDKGGGLNWSAKHLDCSRLHLYQARIIAVAAATCVASLMTPYLALRTDRLEV
jgi:hypothetical protein